MSDDIRGLKRFIKTPNMIRFISLLLTILLVVMMIVVPTISLAAQPTVNLGTTSTFAVLAGSTITNTGTTIIYGDVGLYPGTAFTGAGVTVNGAVHLADAVAIKAKEDLVSAYDDAAGRLPVTRIPTELGGTTLTPGVYDSADGTFQITGTLTLDAQGDPEGVFVFKTDSTLITAEGSSVNLINSAHFCRIFWKVGSSATLGANSHFVGHIFAMISITANTGATVEGQLLARNGAVTLDSNTITNEICVTTPPPTTGNLIVNKALEDGGDPAQLFDITVKDAQGIAVRIGQVSVNKPATFDNLQAGTYSVTETLLPNGWYTLVYALTNAEVLPGETADVTIINRFTEPEEEEVVVEIEDEEEEAELPNTGGMDLLILALGATAVTGGLVLKRKHR